MKNKFSKIQKNQVFQTITNNQFLKFKYLVIIICLLLASCYLVIPPILAADSTPSADIQKKLQELKTEIASKAAKLKQEVNQKLTNKAYIGVVKSKSSTSITLAAKNGTRLISVNQDTQYQDNTPKKKGIKANAPGLDSVKEESSIAALGDVDDTGVLHARKIVILPPTTDLLPKTHLWGQVTSISDLASIKTKEASTAAVSTSNIDTKFKLNDFVIISGVKNKNDIVEAHFLYVIPTGAVLKPKISTPSATPKPTTTSGKK